MTASMKPLYQRLFLVVPTLVASCWLASQKGCAHPPGVTPIHALAVVESTARMPIRQTTELSSRPNRPALKQASDLLRKAADSLERNEPLAVQLIRQALAILQHEGISGIDALDYDRVSTRRGFEGSRQGRVTIRRTRSHPMQLRGGRRMHHTKDNIAMARKGYHGLAGSHPTCHGCGKLVQLKKKPGLAEASERLPLHEDNGVVWHQICFNNFLDQGEEI